jgi:hypothetical protein
MESMKASRRSILFGCSLLLVCAVLGNAEARADILYQTGFEPPDFAAGQPVDGQDVWVATLSPAAGNITTNAPGSGLQSLQVDGGSLDFSASDGLYVGVYNPSTLFNAGGSSQVWIQADVRLDGPSTADDLASANLFVANSNDVLAGSYLSSDGNMYGLTTDDFQQFAPASLGSYHTLGLLLDLSNLLGSYYLDGQLVGTLAIPTSILTDPDFVVGLQLVAAEDDGTFSRADYTGYFDNFSVQAVAAVPEPASIVLLALGIPILAGWAGTRTGSASIACRARHRMG